MKCKSVDTLCVKRMFIVIYYLTATCLMNNITFGIVALSLLLLMFSATTHMFTRTIKSEINTLTHDKFLFYRAILGDIEIAASLMISLIAAAPFMVTMPK